MTPDRDANYYWRKGKNWAATSFSLACVALALLPLFLIFIYALMQGISALNLDFFLQMPDEIFVEAFGREWFIEHGRPRPAGTPFSPSLFG